MSSYVSIFVVMLLVLAPVLLPAGISAAHAIGRRRKRLTVADGVAVARRRAPRPAV